MKLIIFDCDSTLSKIEGIDELARLKGEDVFAKVAQLTHDAMDGKVAIDEVFSKRLDIIQPTIGDCAVIGQQYIEEIEPTAEATLRELRKRGWEIMILSGGFANIIEPLAKHLSITRVEAVPLFLDKYGNYLGYDASYPTTYNGGKPEVIRMLKKEFHPSKIVMVGDGVSDLETKNDVDLFVGFGRYTAREKVKQSSDVFIYSLNDLLDIDLLL